MTTYGSFHAMNPMASGQATFDAGVREGLRRVADGDYPRGFYTRAEVQQWRDLAFDTAAGIVERYAGNAHCVADLLAMKTSLTPRSILKYAAKHQLPVCDLTKDSFGVPVEVWLSDVAESVVGFYGMRCNVDDNPHPSFYLYGAVLKGVTHWRYRDEPEKS